ncbi:MAG: hypothetical protein IPP15_17155 [Saprospiraceae bacterium]|uniref:Uncharacterized protein n=1 Tax=Candidatus Opimibacter skivensis TaxID=2982028 RepID=A0A9D7XP33_9BACT|nr:hypothetical protein [Candidatus Opimibacter skivensis]
MKPSLKTYIIVFFLSGLIFSILNFGFTYLTENITFNLMRSLLDMVLFGALGTLVYYITVVLPKKKPSSK